MLIVRSVVGWRRWPGFGPKVVSARGPEWWAGVRMHCVWCLCLDCSFFPCELTLGQNVTGDAPGICCHGVAVGRVLMALGTAFDHGPACCSRAKGR